MHLLHLSGNVAECFQIPTIKESMKWCVMPTLYHDLKVHTVSAQGMPESFEALFRSFLTKR